VGLIGMTEAKDQPHVFVEDDSGQPSKPILFGTGRPAAYSPLAGPGGPLKPCHLCGLSKTDHVHVEGEVAADAESPKWG
jgi:hypothetical protein